MPLFQKSVLTKHLNELDKAAVATAYTAFKAHFHNAAKQQNIRDAKEEQYQEGFLRDLFCDVLGYTLNPNTGYNLTTEYKNETDSKKADGAVLKDGAALAVIELKGTDTVDLDRIEDQAFRYRNNHRGCRYVITSNYEKIRFYIDYTEENIEWNLFTLGAEDFTVLYLCLHKDSLINNIPLSIKEDSVHQERGITEKLYKDYSIFKRKLYQNIVELNPQFDRVELYRKTQKLLDRFLFLLFAEDKQLIPPNSIRKELDQWEKLTELNAYVPLYIRYRQFFGYMNSGYKDKHHDIFAYNGGLFAPDEILDNISVDDQLLYASTHALSQYDFETEVDVNILGHIFEHSLNDIDSLIADKEGRVIEKDKTLKKKDGVFYTPKYITKYIVENTLGKLCEEKKAELEIKEEDYADVKRKKYQRTDPRKPLNDKLETYRVWLLQLTILDPACGSGAFLNQALEFLIAEHRKVDELRAKLFEDTIVLTDIENHILENNLYGVDLNDESIEIAKLSLWLRTAKRGRKLSSLNKNIKCGNSLIDDTEVAGEKAFKWEEQFNEVFTKGGFDVIVGNPPYGAKISSREIEYFRTFYEVVIGHSEVYYLFIERAFDLLKLNESFLGYIIPNAWLSNKYASKVREKLIKENQILRLINFNKKIIFEDANVETSIIITKNTTPKKNKPSLVGQELNSLYNYQQDNWLNNHNFLMSFSANNAIETVIEKVNSSPYKLADKLDISNGFKPYQVGYGANLEGNSLKTEDIKNRIYHSNIKIAGYKKEIKGKSIKRYSIQWEESYVNWGNWLMSPKSYHYFEQPKILVRQIISDYLFAAIDNDKYYADQSLYVCTNYRDRKPENLLYYLALLNSRLYGFYFRKFYSEEDDLFPKIKVNELKNLPLKEMTKPKEKLISAKVLFLTNSITNLQKIQSKFITLIQTDFDIKPSTNLKEWYLLDFKEFIQEFNKAKIQLTIKQKEEWLEYFTEQKAKALELKNEIDRTDKEIDRMVYELYELTEEEIAIVEGA